MVSKQNRIIIIIIVNHVAHYYDEFTNRSKYSVIIIVILKKHYHNYYYSSKARCNNIIMLFCRTTYKLSFPFNANITVEILQSVYYSSRLDYRMRQWHNRALPYILYYYMILSSRSPFMRNEFLHLIFCH